MHICLDQVELIKLSYDLWFIKKDLHFIPRMFGPSIYMWLDQLPQIEKNNHLFLKTERNEMTKTALADPLLSISFLNFFLNPAKFPLNPSNSGEQATFFPQSPS